MSGYNLRGAKYKGRLLLILPCLVMCFACHFGGNNKGSEVTLHLVHAGSLTVPVKEMAAAFEAENDDVKILTEAWGSKAGARRIIDLENPADVFMSADYMVIVNMLMPDHASWYLPFASNEMAIVYTEKSTYVSEIQTHNWMDILLRSDVNYGRSNPDHDPCGVRTLFVLQLAGMQCSRSGFADSLLVKDTEYIRPKETDLLALLELKHLDYIFLYKSVAIQHGLPYLSLPDSLNLGNMIMNEWYNRACAETLGTKPGETITECGEAMTYAITIPHKSMHPEWAQRFVDFVMDPDKGGAILQKHGHPPM